LTLTLTLPVIKRVIKIRKVQTKPFTATLLRGSVKTLNLFHANNLKVK